MTKSLLYKPFSLLNMMLLLGFNIPPMSSFSPAKCWMMWSLCFHPLALLPGMVKNCIWWPSGNSQYANRFEIGMFTGFLAIFVLLFFSPYYLSLNDWFRRVQTLRKHLPIGHTSFLDLPTTKYFWLFRLLPSIFSNDYKKWLCPKTTRFFPNVCFSMFSDEIFWDG